MEKEIIEGFRLSPQQRRLWSLQQEVGALPFRAECGILIEGSFQPQALRAALANVVSRHEILRTTFRCPAKMSVPLQVITEGNMLVVSEHTLCSLNPAQQETGTEAIMNDLRKHEFDFEKGPLMCLSLVSLTPEKHLLLVKLPALCADAGSLKNLLNEIGRSYAAMLQGQELSDELTQYADCSEWLNELSGAKHGDSEEGKIFWRRQHDLSWAVTLPSESKSGKQGRFEPACISLSIEPDLMTKIGAVAGQQEATLEEFLLACWHSLLWRLTGQQDIVVGYDFDGRSQPELNEAIGLFARSLPIHCHFDDDLRFNQVLDNVKQAVREGGKWQDYFGEAQAPGSNGHRQNFFTTGFAFQEQPRSLVAGDVTFSMFRQSACLERFAVKLSCLRRDDSPLIEFHYDSNLFGSQDMTLLRERFHTLLESVARNPSASVNQLELLGPVERQRILVDFNNTELACEPDVCVDQLIERHAQLTPQKIAVVCEGQQLSYGELNTRATQLAHELQTQGIGPDMLVGICVERSLDMIVGILGILKAGGAYVPLDPSYPKERLAHMLEDARPSVLVTQSHLAGGLPRHAARLVLLDAGRSSILERNGQTSLAGSKPKNLAYLIYTSGSTAKPKGVMITHANLGHYEQSVRISIGVTANDRYLHTASISFSSSVRQWAVPLSRGATVMIATADQIRDPLALFEMIKHEGVTIMDVVPSYWRNCIYALSTLESARRDSILDNQLRLILSASEPLLSDIPRDWTFKFKHAARLINMFGQTETTGIVTVYPIPREHDANVRVVHVGRPIGNTRVYLLNSHLQPVPIGVPGEIHIGGAGVGRGYLNQPELTAQKFIADPFSNAPGARLYKTGDMGRFLPDGTVEFLGRMDNQVKIRGHRVEPGEVEAGLRQHPGVRDAVVTAQADDLGNRRLVAYVVAETNHSFALAGRERYRLPNNMAIAHQNKHETDFFYRQIFMDQTNFKHGITLHDGDCVFDVGANIGLFALFAQQIWKDLTVYAFEPIPAIFETLKANVSLYGGMTKPFQYGLSDKAQTAEFAYYPNSSTQSGRYANVDEDRQVLKSIINNEEGKDTSSMPSRKQFLDDLVDHRVRGESVRCQLRTLSEVICENKIERIDLLKLDVERSELDVLRGVAESDWEKSGRS